MIPREDWRWFGLAAHLCVARHCLFHLATQVGDYVVSTVGAYDPPEEVREIHKEIHGEDPLWHEIGCGRTFETMVFRVLPEGLCECGCGMPSMNRSELATEGYNDAAEAQEGHMAMCIRAAFGQIRQETEA